MALTKIKGASPEEIKTIKDNLPEPIELDWDSEPELAPTREEQEQHNCTSESKSIFNPNSNSDNDDNKNNDSSSAQNSNNFNLNSNFNSNSKQYIAFFDLTKEQELKWFSNNGKSIMSEHTHDTDAEFNLRYPEKDAIKLESHSCIYIDFKIALEILATTMIQLASRSGLAKKKINIKEEIINAEYIGNIIAILQNNSEKAYVIEPNEKIAQTIFLSLVKVVQLMSVGNREELGITAKRIQKFRSTDKIDIPVNITEEEYMLAIKREVKNQAQLFKAEATICEAGKIELTNLYISAKSPKNIKIPIHNTMGSVIKIPKGTIIGYLTTKVEDQPLNHISNFPQLCKYINMGNLDSLQQMQLRMLLSNFNNIFASKNEFGHTNIIQHQIKTGDAMPIKQRA
ncbi:hypothetical protein G9A89_008044 [Geosiphon pyriformis]|nr:hypothetical protein G9A89_008044 [Geosiphon pyriformis]